MDTLASVVPNQVSHRESNVTAPSDDASDVAFRRCYIPGDIPFDGDFERCLKRKLTDIPRPYQPLDDETSSCAQKAVNKPYTFFSFGDNGTTATVTEKGQLMQLSKYLGVGKSSMFVVERADMEEPFHVSSRATQFRLHMHTCRGFGSYVYAVEPGTTPVLPTSVSFLRDQWPTINCAGDGYELKIQWLVHRGILIQKTVLRNVDKHTREFGLKFDSEFLIRDLDFVDPEYSFNEEADTTNVDNPNRSYTTSHGPHGYGLVEVHKLQQLTSTEDKVHQLGKSPTGSGVFKLDYPLVPQPEAVGVIVGIFIDGEARKWAEVTESKRSLLPGSSMEITTAYKLVLLSSQITNWRGLMITANEVDVDRILLESRERATINLGLDFWVRRNLEHIMSVCAIPTTSSPVWEYNAAQDSETSHEDATIAFTCGDVSGHRVSTSASHFAFKFLIEIAKHLRIQVGLQASLDNPLRRQRNRIRDTCRSHLRWVFKRCVIIDGRFRANYWPSGSLIPESPHLDHDRPSDTPQQILKAFEFYKEFDDVESRIFVLGLIKGDAHGGSFSGSSWIDHLGREDKRNSFVWPHSSTSNFDAFRLDDHVWVWNALKALSIMVTWERKLMESEEEGQSEETISPIFFHRYHPDKVQREIINRFTTENEHSKQRMLALTRSARETRFLFHSRDTVLFYELAGQMLSLDTRTWENTILYQKFLGINQASVWENPLRHALAMIMAQNGYPISSLLLEDSFHRAKNTLCESMMKSGLFPGQIGECMGGENLFEKENFRGFYFHATFEVPYVLWHYGDWSNSRTRSSAHNTLYPDRNLGSSMQYFADSPADFSEALFPPRTTFRTRSLHSEDIQRQEDTVLMKGIMPFNDVIDTRNVVDVPEEWLYNFPTFLELPISLKKTTYDSLDELLYEAYNQKIGGVLTRAIQQHQKSGWRYNSRGYLTWQVMKKYFFPCTNVLDRYQLLDVAKKTVFAEKKIDERIKLVEGIGKIWLTLSKPRMSDSAKKRLIWLPHPTYDSALACFLTTSQQEEESISLFFDNYASCEPQFIDEAVRSQNMWRTEFNISYLQLAYNEHDQTELGDGFIIQSNYVNLPPLGNRKFARASLGFRFIGDFCDRFWTCYCIEYTPHQPPGISTEPLEIMGVNAFRKHKDSSWQQRKVLEIMLFNRIISMIDTSTKEIVDLVKSKIRQGGTELAPAKLKSEKYFKMALEWEAYGLILENLDGDFNILMDQISDWETRERDRRNEQPRWTKNDERKYRGTINNVLVVSRRTIRSLRTHQTAVKNLRISIAMTQERIRNDLGLLRNENIRYFTYATVVFLPLGFATSIFSMSNPPSHTVVVRMVICAATGLTLTVIALVSAQKILATIRSLFKILTVKKGRESLRAAWNTGRERVIKLKQLKSRKVASSKSSMATTNSGTGSIV